MVNGWKTNCLKLTLKPNDILYIYIILSYTYIKSVGIMYKAVLVYFKENVRKKETHCYAQSLYKLGQGGKLYQVALSMGINLKHMSGDDERCVIFNRRKFVFPCNSCFTKMYMIHVYNT